MKSVPINSIPIPAWIHDLRSDRLIDANAAAVQRYGYSADEFRAMSLYDFTVGEGRGGTMRHRIKTGEEIEVTLLANDIADSTTTRLLVAAPVPAREESDRDFIDCNAEVIYESDMRGRFIFVNGAVRNVLGFTPASLIGRHYSELVRDDWKEAVVEHYRNQRNTGAESTYYEFPAVAADGHIVWFGQTVQKVVKRDGTVTFRAIGRDVTLRKFADERFHAFMNNSPAVAFIKQSDGRYVYANDLMNRLFATSGTTIVGASDSDLLPAAIADEIHDADAEVIFNHRSIQMVESVPTVDGTTRQWLTYKFPVTDAAGTTYVGGVSIDMTERIALEQELAAARDAALASARQKAQFLANMSHEIRTPMNGVLGMLGVLLDTKLDDDQRDLAQTARWSAENLLGIINDILDFSKIEAGKLTFEVLDFDVRAALEATVDLLSDAARRKSLDIGYILDPEIPPMLRGDAGRLRQILLNLIGNAVKFTESGGVLVQVEREAESIDAITLRFRITDTGIGMSEKTRDQLFQPFMQADNSSTRSFGGTGLGLAISKQLVGMMQGEIGVDSEPGCGSSFWFTARFAHAAEGSATTSPRGDAPRRVLVVEDSTTARHLISFQLTAWGLTNDCANDAATALDMMRDAATAGEPYDVVISDLNMPDMDGVALARIVKSSARFGTPRFVLVTGTARKFDAAKLADLGVTSWIAKPVKQQQLFHAMFGAVQTDDTRTAGPTELTAPRVEGRGRVLIVDDNVVNQKVTARQLQKLGVAADSVGNGVEALHALSRIVYDLVLMDCQMPDVDGYQATAEIRRRAGNTRHTPVIALTASASASDRDRCLAAGMDDFVTKPVREHDLAATLQRWMRVEEKRLSESA